MVIENNILKHLLVHSYVLTDDCSALLFYTLMVQRVGGKMWQQDTPLSGWQRPESYGWIQSGGVRPSVCSGVRRMARRMRRSKVWIDWLIEWLTDGWMDRQINRWMDWLMNGLHFWKLIKYFCCVTHLTNFKTWNE